MEILCGNVILGWPFKFSCANVGKAENPLCFCRWNSISQWNANQFGMFEDLLVRIVHKFR